MEELRLYAIVFRMAALRSGAIPADHGDIARAALLNLIRRGDAALATTIHDLNMQKPYTISLVEGGKIGSDGAHHFGEGDTVDWRFSLLREPAFEALLRRYLTDNTLPHVRLGAVRFGVTDIFASGSHPNSGHTSLSELYDHWNRPPETLPRHLTLEFRSPTAFNLGTDNTSRYFQAMPEPRLIFSSLRKKWLRLGGVAPEDDFDEWVGRYVNAEPLNLSTRTVHIERVPISGFMGKVRFRVRGENIRWLPVLHLLADFAFWAGIGYQTTRGMGQVRCVESFD
ncbi:MAG: hypothetical protein OHK0023_17900 [Anaerolineae bacterium]